MKTSELLREALALIEDPKNWTQKAMSRGMEIDGKPEQFCAIGALQWAGDQHACWPCLLYTSPSPRDRTRSRMPSSA